MTSYLRSSFICAAIAALVATSASANDAICRTNVAQVIIGWDNSLWVQTSLGIQRFCITNATLAVSYGAGFPSGMTVAPEKCDKLYAMFMTAQSTGRPVNLTFRGVAACSFPSWQSFETYPYLIALAG